MKFIRAENRSDKLTNLLFVIYLAALFWIVVWKLNVPFSYGHLRSINFIPFREPLFLNGKIDFGEIIMNVVIFVPLGIYAGILFKRWNIRKKILLFFLTSLMCESLQFILAIGAADITDIIDNTLGGVTGLLLFKGIENSLGNSLRAQKFINVVATTGTITMILFLFLLKIDALWIIGIHFRYRSGN